MSGRPRDWARDPAPGAGVRTEPLGPLPKGPPPRLAVRPRRRRWGRALLLALAVLLVLALVLLVLVDSRLHRVDALGDQSGRPAVTPGADWLIVGSDSREGLSAADRQRLGTGQAAGRRTDTMMLLHIPRGGGQPTLVSLPRDSYVPIPGHGRNRLNAAYAFGGPKLLVQTVEGVTGIRVDHYMEIGFDGFASLVDAVGGVSLCVDAPMNDPKAGLKIGAGCQVLDSRQALGYVRTRASARGDLDRVVRQQQFISALIDKMTSPAVLLNPFRSVPLALNGAGTVAVDEGDHIYHLVRLPFALRAVARGDGVAGTVPIARNATVSGASVVLWDRPKALALFAAIKQDRPTGNLVERK
jgi:LCP family protein required for cell wall assembly